MITAEILKDLVTDEMINHIISDVANWNKSKIRQGGESDPLRILKKIKI